MVVVVNVSAQSSQAVADTSFLGSITRFWWIGLIVMLLLAGILYLIYRFVKKLKEKENVLIKLFDERIKLCKIHKDSSRGKHFFKPSKNQPIIAQYYDGGQMVRMVIGYYMGDFFAKEGNRVVRFARKNCHKWLVLPDIKLLLLNRTPKLQIIERYDKTTKEPVTIEVKLPCNVDNWLKNEIILLGCKGVDKIDTEGLFYVPIPADDKEGQLNPQAFAYEQLKQVLVGEQMITNLDNFVVASKKALDLNTELRAVTKMRDSSGSVDETRH
jgi:hypothetical protein